MKVVVVIPARYGSTRFGGKVLARDTGHYLVEHTWAQARKANSVDSVLIATDSDAVLRACREFGADCVMTSADHQSGTDRIAEAVAEIKADIVVNVQADEPEIDPGHIDFLVSLLAEHPDASMATLVTHFASAGQVADPNVVKCILDRSGRAIYFSRSVIPYDRAAGGVGAVEQYYRHLGIYAFRREFLLKYTKLPQTPLELAEKLEQLRVIEHGYSIVVGKVAHSCEGIDTPRQYDAFVKRWKEQNE
ncbi:MAG: 3-deoxy-manno-octulosonate cytidylyltransferase [Sedimentisphaerales bacterium]|nr:3-deoxy-manno-octulosonate cytidylyltransferase [Sedimentisphaerales bacterium]